MPVTRSQLARFGAPVAFLLGVTIAVLLVRAGLNAGAAPPATTALGPATRTATASSHTTSGRSATTTATTTAAAAGYVTVQKGDTFGSIAASAGLSVSAVEALNPGVSSNALQVGQRIRVK